MDETPKISFEIGGQVKTSAVVDPFKFASASITSLDLDDIQPPSEMDGISYNNYSATNGAGLPLSGSPQLSSLRNRKSGLPSTLVARRAIAGHTSINSLSAATALMKSVDSMTSQTNLENVAPPSLMDELLDSMMSVDSITSEVASDPLMTRTLCGAGPEVSNYETALSDNEDTMTLRSCRDLPLDGSSSNCSSNQSTPVRKKRPGSLTPKMKRELARERFKTYTVDSMDLNGSGAPPVKDEEQVQVVPTTKTDAEDVATFSPPERGSVVRLSAKQKRQENRSRFQTQILDYSEMKIFEIAPKDGETKVTEEPVIEDRGGVNICDDVEMKEVDKEPVVIESEKKPTPTGIKKTLMRLIKPASVESPPEDTNKIVRGKRKSEYVSPYRRPTSGSGTAPGSPAKQTPKAVNATKTTAGTPGQRKSLPTTGLISKLKQVATKKTTTKAAEATEKKPSPPKELNRQGTFTKEEPPSATLPKVSSLPATPTKRVSKLPQVGNGTPANGSNRKSFISTATNSGIPKNGGVVRRQISAPGSAQANEKRKSMIASPHTPGASAKSSTGQLSERSTSSASMKSNLSVKTKLPLSMPASRSNSTMGTPRTPTTPGSGIPGVSKISLYGRAKGLIPVNSPTKK